MLPGSLLRSSATGPPLRLAVIAERGWLSRPIAIALDEVHALGLARVELVVREEPPGAPRAGPLARLADPAARARLLFDAYARWDAARFAEAARSLAPEPVGLHAAGAPEVRVVPALEAGARRYPPDAVARLREHAIDVAIRCGPGRLAGDVLDAARAGVWSLEPWDVGGLAGGAPWFDELARGDPLSWVTLEAQRADRPEPLVLCRGNASTRLEDVELSMLRNQLKPALLGSSFLVRKLRELHARGLASLERASARAAPAVPPGPGPDGVPSNAAVAKFLAARLPAKARERLAGERRVQWRIGIRVGGAPRFEQGVPLDLAGFRWIEAPPGRLWADPFLVERGGRVHCFFEDLEHARGRARISSAVVTADGRLEDVRPALELPHHLSYPCLVEDGGELFLIPEGRRGGTVDLYRAVEFPGRWEKVRTLLDAPGVDTTAVQHGGRWWFFVTVREPEGAGEQLLVLHADSLAGTLRLDPASPVCADARYARSAGSLFVDRGRLIRPSQDCSGAYGRALHFHEVLRLAPGEYEERLLATVEPPPGMAGIHTYNRCGAVEVVDAKRLEPVERRR